MARTEEKVAFAERAVTVHVARSSEPTLLADGKELWGVDSKVLAPGEFMPLSQFPKYLSDAVKKGNVEGLKMMTVSAAKRRVGLEDDIFESDSPELLEDENESDNSTT
jgi:hypothetical protein